MKQSLRHQLWAQRKQLKPSVQAHAAQQMTRLLLQRDYFHQAQTIALYMAHRNEIPTTFILEKIFSFNKQAYLPCIQEARLTFIKIERTTPLTPNQWGILEPRNPYPPIALEQLDLVLVPLVAFDQHKNRLGMGGGYYDKTFAFKKVGTKPILVGLAYHFQQVESVPHNALDIKLDEVITDQAVFS